MLLIGGADHYELGSTIRSAGAFGWQRLLIEDRAGVWFGADRVTQSEGRAAARRARNPIRLIPDGNGDRFSIRARLRHHHEGRWRPAASRQSRRRPAASHRAPGRGTCPCSAGSLASPRQGGHVRPPRDSRCVIRSTISGLIATIALAEIARQIGVAARTTNRPSRRTPRYDFAVPLHADAAGETIFLEDLEDY